MKELKKPLRQGTYKGVKWKSLTTKGQAVSDLLEIELIEYNDNRILSKLDPIGHCQMIGLKYGCSVMEYIENFKVESYYLAKSKFLNNFKIQTKNTRL